jgi:hypothetical protein
MIRYSSGCRHAEVPQTLQCGTGVSDERGNVLVIRHSHVIDVRHILNAKPQAFFVEIET